MKRFAPLMVLVAATLWGSNGIFVKLLADSGFSTDNPVRFTVQTTRGFKPKDYEMIQAIVGMWRRRRFAMMRDTATITHVNASMSVESELITGICFECLIME